jgi:hypothetical protein
MAGAVLIAKFQPPLTVENPYFNLTRFGVELLSLSDGLKRDEAYEQDFIANLKEHGGTVQRALTGIANPGQAAPLEDV